MSFLALAHALRGDRDEALAHGRAASPHIQRMQDVAPTLLPIALVHARHRAEDRAARILGYVDNSFAIAGRVPFPMMVKMREEIIARAKSALGLAEFDRLIATGAGLTEEQALAVAFDNC